MLPLWCRMGAVLDLHRAGVGTCHTCETALKLKLYRGPNKDGLNLEPLGPSPMT